MSKAQDRLNAAAEKGDGALEKEIIEQAEKAVEVEPDWIDGLKRRHDGLFIEYHLKYKLMPVFNPEAGAYKDDEWSGMSKLMLATVPYGKFIRETYTSGDLDESGRPLGIIAIRMSQIAGLSNQPMNIVERIHSYDIQRLIRIVEEVMLGNLREPAETGGRNG